MANGPGLRNNVARAGAGDAKRFMDKLDRKILDLLLHHMGVGLADGITQGAAGPDEFRTAPLWGVGQRVFFLHDGRTSNLIQAIRFHASPGSEANLVVWNYFLLGSQDQQDLINFLRSL